MSGNDLSASLRLQYQARLGTVGGLQLASCGVNEPPREITIHLKGDLRFAPEWYVDPSLTVDLIPGRRCIATFLNFDVTDALLAPLREALQRELNDVAGRMRELTNVRDQAAAIWSALNQPVALGNSLWFQFNLSDVHFRPPEITPDGRYVGVRIALEGIPRVLLGGRPSAATTPLPALATGDVSPEFNVRVGGLITYAEASTTLSRLLSGAGKPSAMRGIRVVGVEVSGRGRDLLVAIRVQGLLTGTLYLSGVPHFEPRRDGAPGGYLMLEDTARFTVETQSPLTRLIVSMFRARIERGLEAASKWDASPDLQIAAAELSKALNRDLTPRTRLAGQLTEFGPGEVRVGPEGLEAWYRVGGKVEIVVKPFE